MRDVVDPELDDLWTCASPEALNRTVDLAHRGLRAPVSILSSFAAGRCIRASAGIDANAFAADRCAIVAATGAPVVVPDDGSGGAYLGVPVRLSSGRTLGSLCVAADGPRAWSDDDTTLLGEIAAQLGQQIDLAWRLSAREDAEQARLAEMVDINHELRTPLQAIVGFTEFLKTETRPHLIHAHVRTIQAAAQSVLAIINQTLDLAGAADSAASERTPVELKTFAETCLSMVGPLALEKRLESRLTVGDDVPPVVSLDQQKVFQALLNLLNNAVKFTDQGGFTLDISRAGSGLRFAVVDTGIGIATEKRDLLFQRFSRIDPMHRDTDGTGLGLAITKTIVESMDGSIGVVPNAEGGTTFWFDIPEIAAQEQDAQLDEPQPTNGASRILLADDLDLNRKLIADMLAIDGHLVDCVADGAAAVQAAGERAYDLILMDMIMPGMDGPTAARAIRALPAPACTVPIVALTANCGREQLDTCLRAGMNAALTKPMTFDGLAAAVATWVRRRPKAA